MKTLTYELYAAPIIDPLILEPPAELSLRQAIELRALSCIQMRDYCRDLARDGHSDYEIAARMGWNVGQVRRALGAEPVA